MFRPVRDYLRLRSGETTSAIVRTLAVIFLGITLQTAAEPASAQSSCRLSSLSEPSRRLLDCGGGLKIELEPSVRIKVFMRSGDAPPRALKLEGGGALIDVVPGSKQTQIRTPHAIAAVRGTVYAVDVSREVTSVFVVRGIVEVRKANGSDASVRLGPGQGVDVSAETPLKVATWPTDRAARLLARFGR